MCMYILTSPNWTSGMISSFIAGYTTVYFRFIWSDLLENNLWTVSSSCVTGTDDVKQQNKVELFGEIDPKVSLSRIFCVVSSLRAFLKWPVLHAGIQTQTYWQVCVVLFTKSRGWESMAATYQRQDEGNTRLLEILSRYNTDPAGDTNINVILYNTKTWTSVLEKCKSPW